MNLEIILGPMYSGKTSKLIDIYNEYVYSEGSNFIIAINHTFDNRFDSLEDISNKKEEKKEKDGNEKKMEKQAYLYSHDKKSIPCIQASNLMELTKNYGLFHYDIILINEAQFFGDLKEFIDYFNADSNPTRDITICVAGLDGDFKRQKFGQILDIIPLCNKVEKLTANCQGKFCKGNSNTFNETRNNAIFSKRLTSESDQVVVGSDIYIPVCRKCYHL